MNQRIAAILNTNETPVLQHVWDNRDDIVEQYLYLMTLPLFQEPTSPIEEVLFRFIKEKWQSEEPITDVIREYKWMYLMLN